MATLAVAALIAALAGAAYFGPHALRLHADRKLRARCRRERALALTFDDGPGAVLTPALQALLAEYGARASFFPLGVRAERATGVLDRLAAAGHEIGAHSQQHKSAWRSAPLTAARDVARGFATLARWLGPEPLFRPPHGKLALPSWLVFRRHRARLVGWTRDSGDTFEQLPESREVLEAVQREGGGVILLHDFDRAPERHAYVLETTRALLELARSERLRVAPVGELLGASRAPRVLAVASGGGHWVQLLRLRPALEGCDVAWVTVHDGYRADTGGGRFFRVPDATRWDRLGVARLALRIAWIVLRERPDVIVSTGAAPGLLALACGRVLGARTVWIDSIANVEKLSLSGERAGRFADLWLTQWPEVARPNGPRYEGSVL